MCRLVELVLGFEVQCMEGRPFGTADFPLDPYFLLPAAMAWIGIRGPRRSLPPCLLVATPAYINPN